MDNVVDLAQRKRIEQLPVARAEAIAKFTEILDAYIAMGNIPESLIIMIKERDKDWFCTQEVQNICTNSANMR